jgi:hypothetical protein
MASEDHDADARLASLEEETRTLIEEPLPSYCEKRNGSRHLSVKPCPNWTPGYRTASPTSRFQNYLAKPLKPMEQGSSTQLGRRKVATAATPN